jgi:hypothetical protein
MAYVQGAISSMNTVANVSGVPAAAAVEGVEGPPSVETSIPPSETPTNLDDFEIDPSQQSALNVAALERTYQVSNVIVQDEAKSGIMQYFTEMPEQSSPPTLSTTDMPNNSMIRPNSYTGGY